MRSSNKSRSRSKNNNRTRNVGNIVNRVFDSAGPEGKVRGTPQQIIEKYQSLTRDASVSGDRVAAENFQQHAEHYARMLSEAQREQADRQAQDNRRQGGQGEGAQDGQQAGSGEAQQGGEGGGDDARAEQQPQRARGNDGDRNDGDRDVIDSGPEDSGLVETPESGGRNDDAPGKGAGGNGGGSSSGRRGRGRSRKTAAQADGGDGEERQAAADTPLQ